MNHSIIRLSRHRLLLFIIVVFSFFFTSALIISKKNFTAIGNIRNFIIANNKRDYVQLNGTVVGRSGPKEFVSINIRCQESIVVSKITNKQGEFSARIPKGKCYLDISSEGSSTKFEIDIKSNSNITFKVSW